MILEITPIRLWLMGIVLASGLILMYYQEYTEGWNNRIQYEKDYEEMWDEVAP